MAKLPARTRLSRALCAPGHHHTAKRRRNVALLRRIGLDTATPYSTEALAYRISSRDVVLVCTNFLMLSRRRFMQYFCTYSTKLLTSKQTNDYLT